MKKLFFVPALVLSVSILFVSCSKEDDKSKTELLTQAGWKPVSIQVDLGSGTYVNESIEACAKDDVLKFETNHSYKTTIGTKCDPSETDENGTWVLSSDEKTLTLDSGDPVSVETLNNSTLVIVESEVIGGMTIKYRATLGH